MLPWVSFRPRETIDRVLQNLWPCSKRPLVERWTDLSLLCPARYCNLYEDLRDAFCNKNACSAANAAQCTTHAWHRMVLPILVSEAACAYSSVLVQSIAVLKR